MKDFKPNVNEGVEETVSLLTKSPKGVPIITSSRLPSGSIGLKLRLGEPTETFHSAELQLYGAVYPGLTQHLGKQAVCQKRVSATQCLAQVAATSTFPCPGLRQCSLNARELLRLARGRSALTPLPYPKTPSS